MGHKYKLWPTLSVERVLSYVFTLLLTLQLMLLAAANSDFPGRTRIVELATQAEVLILPVLFDVVVHDFYLPASRIRVLAAGLLAIWNMLLAIGWIILIEVSTSALFQYESGIAWTVFVTYLIMTGLMAWHVMYALYYPYHERLHYELKRLQ